MLEKELSLEIQKILAELSFAVSQNHYVLLSNLRTLTYFDFITAAAKFSIKTKSNEPKIISNAILRLYSHTIPLYRLCNRRAQFANDVSLGMDFNCLIIFRCRYRGKTVMQRQLASELYLPVWPSIPAGPDSEIGIFDNIRLILVMIKIYLSHFRLFLGS
jgi:dsDNA-specific endonuclease/ATPase MutS2